MSYICGDCHLEHAVPMDNRYVLCAKALEENVKVLVLQVEELKELLACELCDAKIEKRGLSPVCNLCWNKMALQVKDLQGIVDLCVQQGGLSFHVEGGKCPEDDTCDCPDALRVNKAMKGYEPTTTVKPKEEHVHVWGKSYPGSSCQICNVVWMPGMEVPEKREGQNGD